MSMTGDRYSFLPKRENSVTSVASFLHGACDLKFLFTTLGATVPDWPLYERYLLTRTRDFRPILPISFSTVLWFTATPSDLRARVIRRTPYRPLW